MGDIVHALGSGRRFGCEFTYRVQEAAGGIADALLLAEDFASHDKIVVILGDNIFEYSISPYVQAFAVQVGDAMVLLKEVEDPQRLGIAVLDERRIVSIQEKPAHPLSNYAVVGCYMYDQHVFNLIRQIKPSKRGELEITAVNNLYIKNGRLAYGIVQGQWFDAGTFESLQQANLLLLRNNNQILRCPSSQPLAIHIEGASQ